MSVKYCLPVPVAPKPPPQGGSKTQNGRFPIKIALCLKKVFYKVSLCENCQRQTDRVGAKSPIFDLFTRSSDSPVTPSTLLEEQRAWNGLPIGAKMLGEGRPLVRENLADTDPPLAKRRFSIYTVSQKTSPMFLAINCGSIVGF